MFRETQTTTDLPIINFKTLTIVIEGYLEGKEREEVMVPHFEINLDTKERTSLLPLYAPCTYSDYHDCVVLLTCTNVLDVIDYMYMFKCMIIEILELLRDEGIYIKPSAIGTRQSSHFFDVNEFYTDGLAKIKEEWKKEAVELTMTHIQVRENTMYRGYPAGVQLKLTDTTLNDYKEHCNYFCDGNTIYKCMSDNQPMFEDDNIAVVYTKDGYIDALKVKHYLSRIYCWEE